MIIFNTVLSFLLLASGPSAAQSKLVEEGHQHIWRVAVSTDEGELWTDDNFSDTHSQEGQTYPLRLFRTRNIDDEDFHQIDLKIAFDCPNREMGIHSAAAKFVAEDQERTKFLEKVEFDFVGPILEPEDEAMLAIGCDNL